MKTSIALASLLSFAFVGAASAATHASPATPHVEAQKQSIQHQTHIAKTQMNKEHSKQEKSMASNEHLQPSKATAHKKMMPHKKADAKKVS